MVPANWKSGRNRGRAFRTAAVRVPHRRRLRVEPLEERRLLALLTVSNLDDSGAGSLRDAITMANSMAGADTIDFAAGLAGGTIALTSGQLLITQTLTIDATALAESVTIDANLQSRIFNFTAATGNLTLAGLSVTEGRTTGDNAILPALETTHSGGAIRFGSTGTLTIANSVISGSRTQGFAAAGGAIFSNGAIVLLDSTLSGNQTQNTLAFGGGIFGLGSITLARSTITANQSSQSGGGIANLGNSLLVNGSIISGNTASVGPDVYSSSGMPAANFSLIGNTAGSRINGASGVGNVLNQPAGLGPLADNGGAMMTHALMPGSLAIDAGDLAAMIGDGVTPFYDQRGAPFARILGGRIDIGAFEVEPILLIVGTLVDESDGNFAPNDLSLREALEIANLNPDADTISFDASLAGGTILLALGQLEISSEVTFTGLGAGRIAIDAQQNSRVLRVSGTANVEISGVTLTGGNADNGGALRIESMASVTLAEVVVKDSEASQRGGGIWSEGDLLIQRSTISGNTAGHGGGVGGFEATISISDSTLSGNTANYGGGVFNGYGIATITRTTLSGNTANVFGGGIYSHSYETRLSHTIVSGNTAPTGSEVHISYGTVTVDDFNLFGHSGSTTAGALYGVTPGATDITATTNGTAPTLLSGILEIVLADNGGLTVTRALVPGSPAIDAGDIAATIGDGETPPHDQRGAPYTRVFGGRIDIGAFEVQPPPTLAGDYNDDHVVDAADYTVWRNTVGEDYDLRADGSGATFGVSDGVVDDYDYDFWRANYGNVFSPGGGSLAAVEITVSEPAGQFPASAAVRAAGSDGFVTQSVTAPVRPSNEKQAFAPVRSAATGPRLDLLVHLLASRAANGRSFKDVIDGPVGEESLTEGETSAAFDEVFESLGVL